MYLSTKEVLQLDEDKLRIFVENKIPEGLYLDYKENLRRGNDRERKREFLKDVTAFANAHGGNILVGVREPSENSDIDQQILGIENGVRVAQDLERLSSAAVDPRIPGLRILPIALVNGRHCIVVHIPPSLSRPHMVQHEGHRSFYIRHTESSFPMTTHEIRESVITSLSAEARAQQYFERREREARFYDIKNTPSILLQAIPLISLEQTWELLHEHQIEEAIRGQSRRKYHWYCNLASDVAPRVTINGIMGRQSREDKSWITEVHKNGYVSAIYRNTQVQKIGDENKPILHSGVCHLFYAYCELLSELWSITRTDIPYVISCKYINAFGTILLIDKLRMTFTEQYDRDDLIWPPHYRQTSEDPKELANILCLEMFNAFGLEEIIA